MVSSYKKLVMTYDCNDFVRTFRIDRANVRGRHARLQGSLQLILEQHEYPDIVSQQLGQLIALAVILASTIKYQGTFTVQTNSNGPLRMMVVDVTSARNVRGYADFNLDDIQTLLIEHNEPSIPLLMGPGQLTFTVNQGRDLELYQGMVPIEGASLSDCAHNYFRQSEQISTAIVLTSEKINGIWSCAALMLQREPNTGKNAEVTDYNSNTKNDPHQLARLVSDQSDENWHTCISLMSTVKNSELLSLTLTSDELLFNLFQEVSVTAYPQHLINFRCRCSRTRVEATLKAFPKREIDALSVNGQVTVTCEFCNKVEAFSELELAALYAS